MSRNCYGSTNIHVDAGRSCIERNTGIYWIEGYIGGGRIKLRWLPIKHVGGCLRLLGQASQSFGNSAILLGNTMYLFMQMYVITAQIM